MTGIRPFAWIGRISSFASVVTTVCRSSVSSSSISSGFSPRQSPAKAKGGRPSGSSPVSANQVIRRRLPALGLVEARDWDQATPILIAASPETAFSQLVVARIVPGGGLDRLAGFLRHLRRKKSPSHFDQLALSVSIEAHHRRQPLREYRRPRFGVAEPIKVGRDLKQPTHGFCRGDVRIEIAHSAPLQSGPSSDHLRHAQGLGPAQALIFDPQRLEEGTCQHRPFLDVLPNIEHGREKFFCFHISIRAIGRGRLDKGKHLAQLAHDQNFF